MSVLHKLFGNAVQADNSTVQQEFQSILIDNEEVVGAYKLIRDSIIFTTERLLYIDVQGITGSKISYQSIPYSSVKLFSMETAGTLDLDCEIKLYVQAFQDPFSIKFKKGTDLNLIYQLLSKYTLRDN